MTYNSELGPGNFSDQFFFASDENYNFITKMSTNFDQKKKFSETILFHHLVIREIIKQHQIVFLRGTIQHLTLAQ